MLGTFLPDVKIQVHTNPSVLRKIRQFLTYRSSSEAEQEMANVFRLVPFFLPEFLGRISYGGLPPRLIYLDTDNIVLGDVSELADMKLRGHPLAATRYCGIELQQIVDFSLIKRFTDAGPLKEKDCPISRAVMVIDPVKWQFLNISGNFLKWLVRYRDQPLREDLWWHSLDIPPLMLSLYGFLELERKWACVNLGMKELPFHLTKGLLDLGFSHEDLRRMARTLTDFGTLSPPVHRCSADAHLLHFGGPLKPWLDSESTQPVCILPQVRTPPRGWDAAGGGYTFQCQVRGRTIQLLNCSTLWWAFLTETEDCALKGSIEGWPTQPRTVLTSSTPSLFEESATTKPPAVSTSASKDASNLPQTKLNSTNSTMASAAKSNLFPVKVAVC